MHYAGSCDPPRQKAELFPDQTAPKITYFRDSAGRFPAAWLAEYRRFRAEFRRAQPWHLFQDLYRVRSASRTIAADGVSSNTIARRPR